MKKRLCSISVDVDSLQDYVSAYNQSRSVVADNNAIYSKALPRLLELFDSFGIKATFFMVGRDILNHENEAILGKILKKGHEIGNHTMNHIYAFSSLPYQRKRDEILSMQEAVEHILSYRVQGFRAPGYNIDSETMDILANEGYKYDSSIHPTLWDLMIRIFIFFVSRGERNIYLNKEILKNFFVSSKPFFTKKGKGLLEIPLSVTPLLRLPFYGTIHQILPDWFFKGAYSFFKLFNCDIINYHMHAIEMLDIEGDNLDKWFLSQPGMRFSLSRKQKKIHYIFSTFKERFQFCSLSELSGLIGS